jgi:hypothetical protein
VLAALAAVGTQSSICFGYGATSADASGSSGGGLLSSSPLAYKSSEVVSLPSSYGHGDSLYVAAFAASGDATSCAATTLTAKVFA